MTLKKNEYQEYCERESDVDQQFLFVKQFFLPFVTQVQPFEYISYCEFRT